MGIVLDKEVNQDIIDEFQQCKLEIFDTNRVREIFCEYRKKQMQNKHNDQFGFGINAKHLSEWMNCDIKACLKLINRWKSVGGRVQTNDIQALKQLQRMIHQKLSPKASFPSIKDELNTNIGIMPIFCAMTLVSSGTTSDKLKLIIYFFEESKFGSISRAVLDVIVENLILTVAILLGIREFAPKLRRKARRHIYEKNSNDSSRFKQISKGTLAIWLATSPYITRIFCMRNTDDSQKRNKFIRKFYKIDLTQGEEITLSAKSRKSVFRDQQCPSLSAISKQLKGSYLDCSNEQCIETAFKMISKSYSAMALRRNIFGVVDTPKSSKFNGTKRLFDRVDSFCSFSTPKRAIPKDTKMKQYYGGKTPFDTPPVSIDKILANFAKHYNISMKVQKAIRAPALVTEHNIKAVIEGFKALSNGKEYIEKKDIMLGASLGVISRTMNRIFIKSDVRKTHKLKFEDFINSQFGGANNEELDRALSYNCKPPKVYGWTVQKMKTLFDELVEWNGSTNHKEPKIALNEFCAVCVHCEDVREYVIRMTRLQRDRMKDEMTFKECCLIIFEDSYKWNPSSPQSELIWIWLVPTDKEPGFNKEQKKDLKLLFDSMEQRSDGTISQYQLQNATDWILPYTFTESLLPYLFHKFNDAKHGKFRCNYQNFEYCMEYIWFIFQHNWIQHKMLKFRSQTKLNIPSKIETTFPKKKTMKKKAHSSSLTSKASTITSSVPSTAKSDRIDPMQLIKYAESIKNNIENEGYLAVNDQNEKHKNFWRRYYEQLLRMGSAQNAWFRLQNLAVRVQDIEQREAREDLIFVYLQALKEINTKP